MAKHLMQPRCHSRDHPGWSSLKERGRSSPRTWCVVTDFSGFPGRCRTGAGEGSGVKVERPQGEARGRTTLAPTPSGADSVCPGGPGVVGWPCSPVSDVDGWQRDDPVAGHPFATGNGWHGSATAAARTGSIRVVDRATGGGQTSTGLASWLRRDQVHAGRARQRMCPSRSP